MRPHKYRAGEVLNLASSTTRPVPPGRYEIVRRLPERDDQPQYRVKALLDGTEWVLKESEID